MSNILHASGSLHPILVDVISLYIHHAQHVVSVQETVELSTK